LSDLGYEYKLTRPLGHHGSISVIQMRI
jgi:hypothetical protein